MDVRNQVFIFLKRIQDELKDNGIGQGGDPPVKVFLSLSFFCPKTFYSGAVLKLN